MFNFCNSFIEFLVITCVELFIIILFVSHPILLSIYSYNLFLFNFIFYFISHLLYSIILNLLIRWSSIIVSSLSVVLTLVIQPYIPFLSLSILSNFFRLLFFHLFYFYFFKFTLIIILGIYSILFSFYFAIGILCSISLYFCGPLLILPDSQFFILLYLFLTVSAFSNLVILPLTILQLSFSKYFIGLLFYPPTFLFFYWSSILSLSFPSFYFFFSLFHPFLFILQMIFKFYYFLVVLLVFYSLYFPSWFFEWSSTVSIMFSSLYSSP